jgi:TPP-dependent pyruvate/acetoin dehydrogenase alpha subunit
MMNSGGLDASPLRQYPPRSIRLIGSHLPIACGAAWRAQYKGQKDVSVCFFGDGTTNIGAFHEALNFAAVWKLPVQPKNGVLYE